MDNLRKLHETDPWGRGYQGELDQLQNWDKTSFFRMDADQHSAQIRIQIAHPDEGMRALLFDQFREYRSLLHTLLGEEWHWRLDHRDGYGKSHAYIGLECYDWNVFERADWSDLISFSNRELSYWISSGPMLKTGLMPLSDI